MVLLGRVVAGYETLNSYSEWYGGRFAIEANSGQLVDFVKVVIRHKGR